MSAPDIAQLVSAAADQVRAIEALGDEAGAPQLADVEAGIEAMRGAAEAVLSPRQIPRLSADALAAYDAFAARDSSVEALADVHGRSLVSFPDLAQACRVLAVIDVAATAARTAMPASHLETHSVAIARAGREARRRFLRLAATAIDAHAAHELAPAARALLAAEDLDARLEPIRQRLDAEAAAEVARVKAEVARVARADALAARLRFDQPRARKPAQLALQVGGKKLEVGKVIADARSLSVDELAACEAAVAAGAYVEA